MEAGSSAVGSTQPSAPSTALPDPLVGRTLKGTYRVVKKLAEGGMGAVYVGEHVRLGRAVALKVMLREHLSDVAAVTRFRREAEIVGQLEHPYIVQVFDVDETDTGEPYLVMEYLSGETLAARLEREHHLPVSVALRLVSKLASALAATHAHSIVHRDLKPENVFLVQLAGEPEFPKIVDFGISKMKSAARITADRVPLGTPSYMAPEQITAPSSVEAPADQFALAMITFEMLSGELPFVGQDARELLGAIALDAPRKLSEVAPWLGSAFDSVLERALSKRPQERYPSISQFAFALENTARAAGLGMAPPLTPPPGRYCLHEALEPEHVQEPESKSARRVARAERLLDDMRSALDADELDDAVFAGEKLHELAANEPSAKMRELFSAALPLMDQVFSARIGPATKRLVLGPADPRRLNLSPRAAALRALAEGGTSVAEIIASDKSPKRDVVRMLAGLLRRGALRFS